MKKVIFGFFTAALLVGALIACTPVGGGGGAPTVSSVSPLDGASGISTTTPISGIFSTTMDTTTVVAANFALATGATAVTGSVIYDVGTKTAIFTPTANLAANTVYTATIKTGMKDSAGVPLAANKVWTFTTAAPGVGPAPVNLRTAGNYVVLAMSAISTVPSSAITGNVGLSPAAESYLTGFSQTDATGYATSPQVTGFLYAATMAPPTNTNLTTAVADMQTAYTDAAGRASGTGAHLNLLGGNLTTPQTFAAGTYTWGSDLNISSNLTLTGGANDVWIFQISGNLALSSATNIVLTGGAQAKNIFWQVGGGSGATLGTTSKLAGIILSQTAVTMGTGATLNGRALAQTNIALAQNAITSP